MPGEPRRASASRRSSPVALTISSASFSLHGSPSSPIHASASRLAPGPGPTARPPRTGAAGLRPHQSYAIPSANGANLQASRYCPPSPVTTPGLRHEHMPCPAGLSQPRHAATARREPARRGPSERGHFAARSTGQAVARQPTTLFTESLLTTSAALIRCTGWLDLCLGWRQRPASMTAPEPPIWSLGAWPFTEEPRGNCAAQSVAAICTYVPGSNGPGSEKPSIDSTFA